MAEIKWFHPSDRIAVVASRYKSKSAELYLHMSEGDIRRLMNFGKKNQLKPSSYSTESLIFRGQFRIISIGKKKKKASTKPKPAPPIPYSFQARPSMRAKPKTKKKSKTKRKPSEYNLFVKKHRLAGKDMKQIGVLWRKKKR